MGVHSIHKIQSKLLDARLEFILELTAISYTNGLFNSTYLIGD